MSLSASAALTNPVTRNVAEAAAKGVEVAAEGPNTLSATAVEENRRLIVAEVAKEVNPIIQHATNTETNPLSKRTYWAAALSLLATLVSPYVAEYVPGLDLIIADPANQEKFLTAIFGLMSVYMSIRAGTAKKPIGPSLP